MSDTVKISIIKVYDSEQRYCEYCDQGSAEVLQYGVENWLEINRDDIWNYYDAVNKANSYRSNYRSKKNFRYILLEQSESLIEFLFKDADEFVKKQKEQAKKWEEEKKAREKKDKDAKIKREVTRMKKNLKKLKFSQEEIDSKIEEAYGKKFV